MKTDTLMHTSHGIGENAFFDSFCGLVPCKVIGTPKEGDYNQPMLIIEITKTVGGYHKGEQVVVKPIRTVPVDHVYLSDNQYRINPNFVWDLVFETIKQ